MTDPSNEPPAGTHCEWCGAEFEPGTSPLKPRTPAAMDPPPLAADEPTTHCEWCGAEYPAPGDAG